MSPCLRLRSIVATTTVTLALVFSFVPLGDATVVSPDDEARWKNGELLAPLPVDPARRIAALERARATGEARSALQVPPSVTNTSSGTTVPVIHPVRVAPPDRARTVSMTEPSRSEWIENLNERLRQSVASLPRTEDPARVIPNHAPAPASVEPGPNVIVGNTFDGIDDTTWDPAAPDIAAGPDHLLIATTDRFAIMDKCGNNLFSDLFRLYFNQPVSRTYYTPKVAFDQWTPRWVMLYIGTETNFSNSVLYLAVSETVDPLGAWYFYPIPTSVTLPGLKDGLTLSITPEEIYISYNQFNLGTFAFERAVILELVKDDVYSQSGIMLFNHAGMTNPHDASLAFSVQAAVMRTYAGTMYFVNNRPNGGNYFTLWKLTGAPGASVLTGYDMAIGAYASPPPMIQPNATQVDAGDCRVRDAVYSAGNVYAAFTRDQLGSPTVQVNSFDVISLTNSGAFVGGGNDYGYPTIDVDENEQITWAFCVTGPAKFLGIDYFIITLPLVTVDFGTIYNGLANFATGNQPYRWGPYSGAALDPSDSRTVWVQGLYASNAPANSWTTRVGAVTAFEPSHLAANALTETYTAGFEGGPFEPMQIDFQLLNDGGTTSHWLLDTVPAWLTPSAVSGSLDIGESQNVSFFLNATAEGMPAGFYNDSVTFTNCTGSGGGGNSVTLAIGLDGSCPGAQVTLMPDLAPVNNAFSPASTELGAFVTAIRDVSICAVGIEASADVPQNATVHIYAANGTTRGALLASSVPFPIVLDGNQTHVIPIAFDLTACSEYDIAVEFGSDVTWLYWSDPALTAPFDAGGLIRVRNAETDGNAADTRLARIKVFTDVDAGPNSTDLAAAAGYGFEFSADQARGNFVNPERTMLVTSLGIEADLVVGTTLTARIHKAVGAARTGLLAEGSIIVTAPNFTFHDVPISQVLLAGAQYDIEVEWENSAAWGSYSIPPATIPYTVANTMTIYGTETGGVIATDIPHLRLTWSDAMPPYPFTLAKPGQPLPSPLTSNGVLTHGAYITSLVNQEIYGVGVMANIPDGGFLTAYLYRANGTTRGPLVASATVISDGAGMKWHDIPLSATIFVTAEYDIAFTAATVTSWPYWLDTSGLPYEVSGRFRIRDAEASGVIGTAFLAHMRVHACNATLTDVTQKPQRPPMMLLAPAPNPTNAMVRFGFSVDEAGDVEIAVYDVAGKRVAHVARKRALQAGLDAVDFDTSKLASGVYFVKLSTPTKSASRKFVVTH